MTIQLGLKHIFLFRSQICHLSRKREAGRPFRLRPTLRHEKEEILEKNLPCGTVLKFSQRRDCPSSSSSSLLSTFFFLGSCGHTASAPSTVGTHTGGVQ